MKLTLARDELFKTLIAVQGVVEKRNTMPILANILFDAQSNGTLRVSATDLEIGLDCQCQAKVKEPGKMTLNARNIMDITKLLPSKDVLITKMGNAQVEISCGKALFKLHGLSPDDFPSLPDIEQKSVITFPAKDLLEMIDYTSFSISQDETRYNLSGVYLEQLEGDLLRMTSSDGHRLSLVDRTIKDSSGKLTESIIIPKKGLMEIRKLCEQALEKDADEKNAQIHFSLGKNNCQVQHDKTRLVIRLIDGEFPEYRQVIPSEEGQKVVVINREVFLNALKRIAILSQEKTKGVRFQFEKNTFKITATNPDLGEAEEELDVQYNHPTVEIGFNYRYFTEALNAMRSENIDLLVSDGMSQGVLRPQGEANFKAVVMPMKLL